MLDRKAYARAWYARNRERVCTKRRLDPLINEKARAYYWANHEKCKKHSREHMARKARAAGVAVRKPADLEKRKANQKIRSRAWYLKNRTSAIAKSAKYYSENKNAIDKKRKEYCLKNRKIVNAKAVEYQRRNPIATAARKNRWLLANRDQRKVQALRWAKKSVEQLQDAYIKRLLAARIQASSMQIPQEMVEAKRAILKIKRMVKDNEITRRREKRHGVAV